MFENLGYLVILGIIALLLVLFFSYVPVGLWISALAANVKVGIFDLIGMRLRRVSPKQIVIPFIKATKAQAFCVMNNHACKNSYHNFKRYGTKLPEYSIDYYILNECDVKRKNDEFLI